MSQHPLIAAMSAPWPPDVLSLMPSKGRKGYTTVDLYALYGRLEEIFGPCGIGWGVTDLAFHAGADGSVACSGEFWYVWEGKDCRFHACGSTDNASGSTFAEAHKMAASNLISKACLALGVLRSEIVGHGVDGPTPAARPAAAPASTSPAVDDSAEGEHRMTTRVIDLPPPKSGVSGRTGKPWTMYKARLDGIGGELTTFDSKHIDTLRDAAEHGLAVDVSYETKRSGKFLNRNIKSVTIADKEPAETPAPEAPAGDDIPF